MECQIKGCSSLAMNKIEGGYACTEHHEQIVKHLKKGGNPDKIRWKRG
ncbi:hypothetical protein KAU43_05035 [candidate division WOR-3 bacterium]|nr:hypothetical protein [candidate division WOR-3 bacterium]